MAFLRPTLSDTAPPLRACQRLLMRVRRKVHQGANQGTQIVDGDQATLFQRLRYRLTFSIANLHQVLKVCELLKRSIDEICVRCTKDWC